MGGGPSTGLASWAKFCRPYGAFDRGCWGDGSALRWVVFAGWLPRGGSLRVAQNEKGDRGGGGGLEEGGGVGGGCGGCGGTWGLLCGIMGHDANRAFSCWGIGAGFGRA